MTPTELSRALARDVWADTEAVHTVLSEVDDDELALLVRMAQQHPRWLEVPVRTLVNGYLDGLADQGLVECDPLDAFRWRVHPKVVRVLLSADDLTKGKYGFGMLARAAEISGAKWDEVMVDG